MAKNLIVVESPAKARTLQKYLGRGYKVCASVGHILDLPKSKLGVDIEKDFEPQYQVIKGKASIVAELRKAAKDAEMVYLAPDPDREGEAIAWHIADRIGVPPERMKRVLFHEITKDAVKKALANPCELDRNRYDAQQARRVLDRLVGYQVSPLLWKKVRRGLSAGRVQSVAVRIVVERERLIEAFQTVEYWSVTARVRGDVAPDFDARLVEIGGQRLDPKGFRLENEAQALRAVEVARQGPWQVGRVETKERRRNPQPPFITSRLQQEASRKLSYNPRRTMGCAQRLYEGVEIGSEGLVGLITYMRTDSTRVSPEAQAAARELITSRYGARYVPERPPIYKARKQAQDAHEAIRPTSVDRTPEVVQPFLEPDEFKLYQLIWNRFVASQMAPALFDQTAADFPIGEHLFRANGQVTRFDGFMRVYTEGVDDKPKDSVVDEAEAGSDEDRALPPLRQGQNCKLLGVEPAQHFTQPPPRFNQATLIKELEEKGIGRPSTYASIMGTILEKEYCSEDESRRLHPTELGTLVNGLLVDAFPDVFDIAFTAGMEEILDKVEEGEETWVNATRRFYEPFAKDLELADERMPDLKTRKIETDLKCELDAAPMVIRWGRRGEFLTCENYPECRNSKNFTRAEDGTIVAAVAETVDRVCPECSKPMQIRFGRFGKFVGCTGYPECKQVQPFKLPEPIGLKCPDCGVGEVVAKNTRRRKIFYGCQRYPKCEFSTWDKPIPEPCPLCNSPYVIEKVTKKAGTERLCPKAECTWREAVDTPVAEPAAVSAPS